MTGKRTKEHGRFKRPTCCNLDVKNPNKGGSDFDHLPPEQLIEDVLKKELQIIDLVREIKAALTQGEFR